MQEYIVSGLCSVRLTCLAGNLLRLFGPLSLPKNRDFSTKKLLTCKDKGTP